jgi:hypothetical protein
MKTTSSPFAPPVLSEDDIRAYAEHLFVQSGRVPDRDLQNWFEAKACLEANLPSPPAGRSRPPHPAQPRGGSRPPHGFTMPPNDSSLWIEKEACDSCPPFTPSGSTPDGGGI